MRGQACAYHGNRGKPVKQIAALIHATLNLRVFLPLLAVTLASTWYGLFWSVDRFAVLTGGLRFMDMQPRLTVEGLFEQIRTYPLEAVDFYFGWLLFDVVWPFLGFATMLYIMAWLLRRLPAKWNRRFPLLVGSALLTVLMDWGENIGFASLLLDLPDERNWLAHLTLTLHAAKLFFNMMFNIGLGIVLVAATVMQMRERFVSP